MGPLAIINIVGAANGMLVSAALAMRKKDPVATNRILAGLVFCVSVFVLGAVATTTGFFLTHPHFSFIHDPLVLLCAPLLFLYVRSVVTEQQPAARDAWHFVPAIAFLLLRSPYYLQSSEAKLEFLHEFSTSYTAYFYLRSALVLTQVFLYMGAILVLAGRASSDPRSAARVRRGWRVPTAIVGSGVAVALLLRIADVVGLLPNIETNLLVPSCATVLVLYAVLRAFRGAEPDLSMPEGATPRYRSSTLTAERAQRCLARLSQAMENDQCFRDGDLTLQSLASKLGLPAAHLSQVINEKLGQTFTDYVNSYRVAYAQAALLDPSKKHCSVLALGEESGFNSKSSFNAVFKKHSGMTPSEFRLIPPQSAMQPDISASPRP